MVDPDGKGSAQCIQDAKIILPLTAAALSRLSDSFQPIIPSLSLNPFQIITGPGTLEQGACHGRGLPGRHQTHPPSSRAGAGSGRGGCGGGGRGCEAAGDHFLEGGRGAGAGEEGQPQGLLARRPLRWPGLQARPARPVRVCAWPVHSGRAILCLRLCARASARATREHASTARKRARKHTNSRTHAHTHTHTHTRALKHMCSPARNIYANMHARARARTGILPALRGVRAGRRGHLCVAYQELIKRWK